MTQRWVLDLSYCGAGFSEKALMDGGVSGACSKWDCGTRWSTEGSWIPKVHRPPNSSSSACRV